MAIVLHFVNLGDDSSTLCEGRGVAHSIFAALSSSFTRAERVAPCGFSWRPTGEGRAAASSIPGFRGASGFPGCPGFLDSLSQVCAWLAHGLRMACALPATGTVVPGQDSALAPYYFSNAIIFSQNNTTL